MPPNPQTTSRRVVSRSRSRARPSPRKVVRSRSASRVGSKSPTPHHIHTNGVAHEHQLTAEELYNIDVARHFTPERDLWDGKYEFSGPVGAALIMLFSHVIIFYFYLCIEFYSGTMIYPGHAALRGAAFLPTMGRHLRERCRPGVHTTLIFLAFLFIQYVFAALLPGVVVKGLPLPSENGYRLRYKCNAVTAMYCMLILIGALHYTGVYPIHMLRVDFGQYLTIATVVADVLSVWVFVLGLKRPIRMTGNLIYDFFMGSALNFRLPGDVDVKLFVECRNSWVLLFLLTLSCAAEQYRTLGYITGNMMFMITAHLLYVNAVQKGEECIVTTWDIYYEKFGWMLAYWNTCGVPFLYCMQSLYIQAVLGPKEHPRWVLAFMFVCLFICYYCWDTINSQKNRFRLRRSGVPLSIIKRSTFPQMPWRYIENPRTLKNERGELFVDGFYRYARKLHYTVDISMAFLWGCSCGFASFIPFFYVLFFTSHLVDRVYRDEHRCRAKYGALWDRYVAEVPYRFIPYVF